MTILAIASKPCDRMLNHSLNNFSLWHHRQEKSLQGLQLRPGRGARRGEGGDEEGPQIGVRKRKFNVMNCFLDNISKDGVITSVINCT